MNAVIDELWRQAEPTVYISRDEWERALDDWTIEPGERDGALAFVILTRGPEFHFTVFGSPSALIWLPALRARVAALIDEHGFALTRTPKELTKQRREMEMSGFVAESEDEFYIHYRIVKPTWRRSCPS